MERGITVVSDVKDLGELLSGASVDQASIVPDGRHVELTVELTRAILERQVVVRQGLFKRAKTPWTKCRLTLRKITSVAVKRVTEQEPHDVPILQAEAVSGGYQLTVHAPDGLQLLLGLDTLDGLFADVGAPIESP